MIAAATEILRLWVNPCIGIFKRTSALSNACLDNPFFSPPKNIADFFLKLNLSISIAWEEILVQTIWYPLFLKFSTDNLVLLVLSFLS